MQRHPHSRGARRPRLWPILLLAASAAAHAPGFAAPQTREPEGPSTWARARAGAIVRNFGDANGNELARLEAGHPVRVYGTTEGIPPFHEVEVAGGVPVWVFGELLQPTGAENVLRVSASHVNMRPLPESSPRSMALRSKLQPGDRVLVIERQDASKPLAEDWVKVYAPETARVWIAVDHLESVPASDAAATAAASSAWTAARRNVPTARETERAKTAERERERETAREAAVPPEAVQSLTEADAKYEAALQMADPSADDWTEVLGHYRAAHELAPEGSVTAQKAFQRLKEVEARREHADLRASVLLEDQRRQEELERLAREAARTELEKTVHWGRFQGRGWLESRVIGGERRWYLVWNGETTAEVRCMSGRYDVGVFEGYEIGVAATTIHPPVGASATTEALPRVLDILRIEVISGSTQKRR